MKHWLTHIFKSVVLVKEHKVGLNPFLFIINLTELSEMESVIGQANVAKEDEKLSYLSRLDYHVCRLCQRKPFKLRITVWCYTH